MEAHSELATQLHEFVECASDLWQEYHDRGPGKLDPLRFASVETAADALQTLFEKAALASPETTGSDPRDINALRDDITQVRRLAQKCACTPQGLSFITGEAGLIPRRDQHAAFEDSLARLRQDVTRLQQC